MNEDIVNEEKEETEATNESTADGAGENVSEPEVLDAEKKDDAESDVDTKESAEEQSFKDKFYYLAAEFENFKKRSERDRDQLLKYGNEKVLSGLVDVVDNLDRTLDALVSDEDEKVKNIVTGVDMVRNQFLDVLKKSGLDVIETEGQKFDPNFHEAMAQQPAEGKEDDDILTVFQKGYVLNGRLLRAAKVIIVKN